VKHYTMGSSAGRMGSLKNKLIRDMLDGGKVDRGEWQSEIASKPELMTYEIPNALLEITVPSNIATAQLCAEPDLPWAEVHHLERVGGFPLNPAPSYVDWPWHSKTEAERHVAAGVFSHTYPERYWPKTDLDSSNPTGLRHGVRYPYGDLMDVVNMLKDRPFTRQAYLPMFFPEDTGATEGQRIPCTLGYHFIRNGRQLDMNYFLRSCDITRHLHNDIYLAMRMLQWVCGQLTNDYGLPAPGTLTLFVSNLHMFEADRWRYLG
jgi:hypothetical protein